MTIESDRELALKTLREICEKDTAPAQAKAGAARTILEMLGDIGRLQEQKKDNENKLLSEMSKSELDAEIAKIARVHEPIPISERRPKLGPSKRLLARQKRDARRAKKTSSATPSAKQYDF